MMTTSKIEKNLPLICGLITYKNFHNYYAFAFSNFSSVEMIFYNIVTFVLLASYIYLFFDFFHNREPNSRKLLWPAILIPLAVLGNTLYVMIDTGSYDIISREYINRLALGTNDEKGYYFAQINTWFCNMAIILLIYKYMNSIDSMVRSVVSCVLVMAIPTILIVLQHPEFLGVRESYFNDDSVNFGGGLWNIGVMAVGSLMWPAMMLMQYCSKKQKRIITSCLCLFVFVGVAGISRTLILMLIFSTSIYLLLAPKDNAWTKKVGVLLLAVSFMFIVEPGFIDSINERFHDHTSGTQNVRLLLWVAYMSHFSEFWIIGAPVDGIYNYFYDVDLIGEHFLPHSAVINFCARFGIIAAFSYLCLIKKAFFYNRHLGLTNDKVYLFAGCAAYVILAFINQTGYAEPIFYVMFGILLAYRKIMNYEQL